MTHTYKFHTIHIKELGTETTNGVCRKKYYVEISGKLAIPIERISASTSQEQLLETAKKEIDNAFEKLENNAILERKITINHFEYFREYLKNLGIKEEDINKFATELTVAQIKKESIQELSSELGRLDSIIEKIEFSFDNLCNAFKNEYGLSIASIIDNNLDKFFDK